MNRFQPKYNESFLLEEDKADRKDLVVDKTLLIVRLFGMKL